MSLTLRLTLTYVLITLGGLLLLGGGGVWLFGVYTAQQRAQELENQANIYAAYVSEVVNDAALLDALAPGLAARAALPSGVAVRIFAVNGALIGGDRQLGPFPSRPALALVRNALPLPASQVGGRRYTARTIGTASNPIGIVELSQSTEVEGSIRRNLIQTLIPIAVGATLVMAMVSSLVARSIARPVRDLQQLAEALAAGTLDHRSDARLAGTSRHDEIGGLASSLNNMADQLEQRIGEAENERGKLAAVLAGISEGVVALDKEGAVLFANPAAATLLQIDEQNGTMNDPLITALQRLDIPLLPRKLFDSERQLERRTLLVTATPITHHPSPMTYPSSPQPAAIIVLRDISRLKALEQTRTEVVRSISHELRTPLTALRGLIEQLQDDAIPQQQAPLATLEGEMARLGRLVEELLRPSSLPVEQRPIEIGTLVRDLVALQQGRARRAGISLNATIDADAPLVLGNRDRLKQAFLNLLDNALRAAPPGGAVQVQVASEEHGVRITIDDSGPGVPVELRERVWEPGATGANLGLQDTGGAGLGLALVREIVTAHNGRISIDDSPLGGARFVVKLPVIHR